MSNPDFDFSLCSNYIVKYPDCNSTKNLFGGQLLAWVDEQAAIYAAKYMNMPFVVTAHFGGLNFKVPIELGSIVKIYCKVSNEGNTSLTVDVMVNKSKFGSSEEIFCAENKIVFVSVDSLGKPIPWEYE